MKVMNKVKVAIIIYITTVFLIGISIFNSNAANNTNSSSNTANTSTNSSSSSSKTSSNANLSNLGIRPYDFSGFRYATTKYEVTVPANIESVEVYAQAQDSKAKVSGTGTKELKEGENIAEVTVTAEDGTTKTYTITITKESSSENPSTTTADTSKEEEGEGLASLNIQNVEISPEFKTNVYEYTAKYIGEATSMQIQANPTNEEYTVEIVGNEELKEGENIITILVSESNGDNVATYQITLNKSLVDEEAIAKEQANKEKQQKIIIGSVAAVLIILIIIIVIIKKRRNRIYAEEYSGVPFYGINDEDEDEYDEYDEDEEEPKALRKNKKAKRYEDIDEEELDNDEDVFDKTKKEELKEKFLDGYNKKTNDYEDYEMTNKRSRHKGKRFK